MYLMSKQLYSKCFPVLWKEVITPGKNPIAVRSVRLTDPTPERMSLSRIS